MGIKVCPERNRHGEPPSFATLNQTCLKPTRPRRVTPSGTWYKSDYEATLIELRQEVRLRAIEKIHRQYPEHTLTSNIALTNSALKRGACFVLDAQLQDDRFSIHFDALKRADGGSDLGDFHYQPVLFYEGRHIRKAHRLLLETLGLLLSRIQGRAPSRGIIYHGSDG